MQSSTVVGYQNLSNDGTTYPSIGATFVPLSGEGVYRLGDMKMGADVDPDGDVLQLLDPDTTELVVTYAYCSEAYARAAEIVQEVAPGTFDAWIGWWNVDNGFDPDDEDLRADDEEINVGQAFLGLMGDDITFECNGEVPQEPVEITNDGCVYPFICNMIPREIKLGWIVGGGDIDPDGDVLQLLDNDTTELVATYAYCSEAYARAAEIVQEVAPGTFDAWIGWWNVDNGFDPDDEDLRADDVDVPAGQAWLGLMGDDITLAFPSALYNGEDAE